MNERSSLITGDVGLQLGEKPVVLRELGNGHGKLGCTSASMGAEENVA